MTSEFDIDLILKKEPTEILNIETQQVDVTSSDIYKEQMIQDIQSPNIFESSIYSDLTIAKE